MPSSRANAASLGDAGSLIWPLGNGVVRLSFGLEDIADLELDFREALVALDRHAPNP